MKNKLLKILGALVPLSVCVGSLSLILVLVYSTKKSDSNQDPKEKLITFKPGVLPSSNEEVFPKLNSQDFYRHLRISSLQAIISESMVSEVVAYVVSQIEIGQKDRLWYGVNQISPQEVVVGFELEREKKRTSQTYRLRVE
ncbi:MHO_1590 family protein [Mycoplasma sp. ATU-Cv-703]|uniref:MHO_1590 family protein n=1 Tax=Mycoplasma sp. ATU-Cv-703 TaxID=2498595 RepID=UPI000FDD4EA7